MLNVCRTDHIGDDGTDNAYKDGDLRCGHTVKVFGREILLLKADEFTKKYYRETYNIEQEDVEIEGEPESHEAPDV